MCMKMRSKELFGRKWVITLSDSLNKAKFHDFDLGVCHFSDSEYNRANAREIKQICKLKL